MKKKITLVLIVLISILTCISTVEAKNKDKAIDFNIKYWRWAGTLNWTVSGYTEDPYSPGDNTPFKSELNWDMNSTHMLIFNGKLRPLSWLSINLTSGIGFISSGVCTDTDWLLSYSSAIPWIETKNPAYGSTFFYNANINFYLLKEKQSSLGLFVGYGANRINLVDIDPLSYIYSEWTYYGGADTYPGLNSTYDIIWKGFRIGLKEEIQPIPQLTLSGKVSYSPVYVDGEGFWNLRTDVDPAGWRFYQSGRGNSLECELDIGITPIENMVFHIGYRYQIFAITESDSWDNCKTSQSGIYIRGELKL